MPSFGLLAVSKENGSAKPSPKGTVDPSPAAVFSKEIRTPDDNNDTSVVVVKNRGVPHNEKTRQSTECLPRC